MSWLARAAMPPSACRPSSRPPIPSSTSTSLFTVGSAQGEQDKGLCGPVAAPLLAQGLLQPQPRKDNNEGVTGLARVAAESRSPVGCSADAVPVFRGCSHSLTGPPGDGSSIAAHLQQCGDGAGPGGATQPLRCFHSMGKGRKREDHVSSAGLQPPGSHPS